ncbi:unnamed protein product [Thelazia callipaeda]|uniref:EGF-like domain-containing protein n=1 Tax=Thelazia callipaeda TaxID=103827 RepID=A0A0N5CW65_THECL|nr:unnamed protein product [Thelazia callipaeda]
MLANINCAQFFLSAFAILQFMLISNVTAEINQIFGGKENSLEHNIQQYGRTNFSCFNGGSLINGKCHCQERFEGEACEIEPCLHGGRKSAVGKCHCPFGLTGEKCEIVTHCIEGKGKLDNGRCKCNDRWTGIFCQTRMCHNGVSVGTGTQMGSFCLCDIGFTGPFCETAIECIHGAITTENICTCAPNWEGEDCNQCAYGYQIVGDDCKLIVTEDSLVSIENPKVITLWSTVLVSTAVILFVLLIVTVTTIYFKKCNSKPSRIGSDAGTDV